MVVVAVRAFSVSWLRGVSGSYVSVPDSAAAELIVQFKPKGMICEVFGPAGSAAAGALRCWSQPARNTRDRRVTDRLAKGV